MLKVMIADVATDGSVMQLLYRRVINPSELVPL